VVEEEFDEFEVAFAHCDMECGHLCGFLGGWDGVFGDTVGALFGGFRAVSEEEFCDIEIVEGDGGEEGFWEAAIVISEWELEDEGGGAKITGGDGFVEEFPRDGGGSGFEEEVDGREMALTNGVEEEFGIAQAVRAGLDEVLEALEFAGVFVDGGGGGGVEGFCAEGGEVFGGELDLGGGGGEFADEALVEGDGFVVAVLFAADFGEAEEGGGGEGLVFGVAGEELLVLLGGFLGVAGDFLGEEGVAEEGAEVRLVLRAEG
jgi:hypothetical protein